MFVRWGFDAVTVNAYAGMESVRPFSDYEDRGVIVLCRTSNPGSDVFQELNVQHDRLSRTNRVHLFLMISTVATSFKFGFQELRCALLGISGF